MEISKELRIEFNKRFANGEQYIKINQYAQDTVDDAPELQVIEPIEKNYYWEQRAVYNKILPIIEYFDHRYKNKINQFIDYESLIYGENGLVERLIPLQIEYNNIRNKKNEYFTRLSVGVAFVEDGAIDVDELSEQGLQPGGIIIYRQGSVMPSIVQPDIKHYEVYSKELDRLEKEIAEVKIEFQNNVLDYLGS